MSLVFASQLYWAGYITTWTKAFWSGSVYWLSWGMVAPLVFGLCRTLNEGERAPRRYIAPLLLGGFAASLMQSLLVDFIGCAGGWLEWWLSFSKVAPTSPFAGAPLRAIRLAGINLPVFGTIVLGWHAVVYHRETRDRQLRSAELESLLRQAQLQALRSQLNPHFLFNTLHSIAELVGENPPLAEQLILRLGQLLRRALQPTGEEVALEEELGFIRGYLEIEQIRLGDRLRVRWEIGPDVLGAKVPSLILQPLVENAIQHGIAPSGDPGELLVRARHENGMLQLQVRDSGPGLPSRTPERRTGTGLQNTQARLVRLYGDRHQFELINDNGLIADVRIPLSMMAEPKTNPS